MPTSHVLGSTISKTSLVKMYSKNTNQIDMKLFSNKRIIATTSIPESYMNKVAGSCLY